MAGKLRFTIDGVVFHAVLQDNPLAEKLVGMCPFTADFSRSGDHEYYAAMSQKASAKGCASTTKGHANGLYYFEGWNALSLVIRDCDTVPFQINHIGDFDGDVSAALKDKGASIRVTCEAE